MANFVEMLSNVSGTSFVGIDTETLVTLTGGRKNPMQGRVTKRVVNSNVVIFQNKYSNGYANMVKRRLEAEGKDPNNFELSPRKWGERIHGMPLVRHEKDGATRWYFEVIFIKSGDVTYLLDGQPIAKEDIEGLPSKSEEGEQGGLDNHVIIRTYALDSIRKIRIDHNEYEGPFEVAI